MTDSLKLLKKHFLRSEDEDCDNTFLIQIRVRLNWDKDLFLILVREMQICCRDYETEELVEKWIAEGFWYMSQFVRDWTTHPNFPKQFSSEYYEKAYCLLDDLAFYFFIGNHPRIDNRDLVEVFIEETA